MAKTIDHMKFYVDVTPYKHGTVQDQTFDTLSVSVAYRKGQGFVAYYHPGWKTCWGGYSYVFDFSKEPLTAGFTVLVEQAARNNVKRLTTMLESLKLAKDGIRYFFDQRDWTMLRWLLESAARVGYTPSIEAKVQEHMKTETNDNELNELNESVTMAESPMMKAASKREQSGAGSDYAEREQARSMSKQWRDLKAKHPDALLLFRCGDFYESYGEDAKVCARDLGITLTFGTNDKGREWPMAGFPQHALDTYLPKLIRNGHRVAICDQLEDPRLTKRLVKRGSTEQATTATSQNDQTTNNPNNQENMAQNMKAADLIGKTIENKEGTMQYRVMNVDGDKLNVEFVAGNRPAVTMPMPWAQVEKLLSGGWKVASTNGPTPDPSPKEKGEATASDDVVVMNDVQPTAKTVKMEQPAKPKRKRKSQPKSEEVKCKYTYETYQTSKGKTGAKIRGFAEGDAMLERTNAESIHASSTYERDAKGEKHYMLIFGPRYAAAAKEVCEALNAGKSLDDCKAIIDAATEERQQKREAWKQKRAEYQERKASGETKAETKVQGYSDADVAEMLKRIMAGGDIPEAVKKAMTA